MPVVIAATLTAAFGQGGASGFSLVLPLALLVFLIVMAGRGIWRHRRHSAARRDNPPSEPDGSKAQPPERRP